MRFLVDALSYTTLKNSHQGETCVIIGNGPGLKSVPVEFLRRYPSFGVNRITMMLETDDFVPTFYSCIGLNQLYQEDQRATIYPMLRDDRLKAAFINRLVIHFFRHPKVYSILGPGLYNRNMGATERMRFSYDPLDMVAVGASQTFISLQLAYYMGFTTALIVGMDYSYAPKGDPNKHFYSDDEFPGFEIAPGPRYGTTKVWQKAADIVMKNAAEAWKDRTLLNLSEPTECTVIQKGRLEEWL